MHGSRWAQDQHKTEVTVWTITRVIFLESSTDPERLDEALVQPKRKSSASLKGASNDDELQPILQSRKRK